MPREFSRLAVVAGLAFCAAGIGGGIVAAGDVIVFANGTSMAVESHRVENGMVHVDLGDESTMAFPEYMVERIESAGQGVVVHRRSSGGNRMVASRDATPEAQIPDMSDTSQRMKDNPHDTAVGRVETDEKGVDVWRPFANGAHDAKRKIGATGSQRVRAHQAARMGREVGGRQIIGSRSPRGRGDDRPEIVGFERNPNLGGGPAPGGNPDSGSPPDPGQPEDSGDPGDE